MILELHCGEILPPYKRHLELHCGEILPPYKRHLG